MTDNAVIPRHLRVLAETWAELVDRLDRSPTLNLPHLAERLDDGDRARFVELATRETSALSSWIERVIEWFNGPLPTALGHADIADQDMRRVAGRLSHFADELIERRQTLRTLAGAPAMRAAAPRLDAMYLSLLKQVRDFAAGVVDALGPRALEHPNGTRQGGTIELSFTFRPNLDRPVAEFLDWAQRVQA